MEAAQEAPITSSAPSEDAADSLHDQLEVLINDRLPGGGEIADEVMQLLVATGHVLPGCPPAQRIFQDAKRFHDQLTLTALALRILNMLAFNNVQTPESKPARKWIDDYLQGINHGPAGQPMLWPGKLPGMASLLRDWGFVPTIALPGQASYVARAQPNPTVQ